MNDLLLIVGLGNPGSTYRHTRHNVGFMVLDRLAHRFNASFTRYPGVDLATLSVTASPVLLAKPLSFMNASGDVVAPLLNRFRLQPDRLLVVYDDIHLPLGQIRIRGKGSSGGHNGLESIRTALSSESFNRLRCGIGQDQIKDLVDFVLSPFTEEEHPRLETLLDTAVNAAQVFVQEGLNTTMNRFNTRIQ
jgi:PTH1 family peptidyl-tRNA hydrolase